MLQYGPVFQQWEQHKSQPAAEGDGGHAGWGWRGQLLCLLQGRAKTTRCCLVLQPERCPQASRVCARTAGQQDAAEVAHPDQEQALCLSLVLELPGTRQLGWVCAQHQGNKMCLSSSAAHQGWDMPVFGIGE